MTMHLTLIGLGRTWTSRVEWQPAPAAQFSFAWWTGAALAGTRMSSFGAIITQAIPPLGRDEFLRRLSHPFGFQSLGASDAASDQTLVEALRTAGVLPSLKQPGAAGGNGTAVGFSHRLGHEETCIAANSLVTRSPCRREPVMPEVP
jgi:hypothetical protein